MEAALLSTATHRTTTQYSSIRALSKQNSTPRSNSKDETTGPARFEKAVSMFEDEYSVTQNTNQKGSSVPSSNFS